MPDVYIQNPETKQIVCCVSLSPWEFNSIGTALRLLWQTGINIKNTTGAVERLIIWPESIKTIH